MVNHAYNTSCYLTQIKVSTSPRFTLAGLSSATAIFLSAGISLSQPLDVEIIAETASLWALLAPFWHEEL